jgi:catechol 2,3-dioxygenase
MAAKVRLGHVALPAQHPSELATFYREFLGLDVTMEGALPSLGEFAFLSDRPEGVRQTLALVTKPDAKHVAWEVESLAALKALYAEAKARGIHIAAAFNHRETLSFYVRDPEGNGVEIYWPTGQQVDQPFAQPLGPDQLEQPDSVLLALVGGSAPA